MKKIKYTGHVSECQICQNKNLKPILSLGHQPVVQEYLTKESLDQPEVTYSLNLVYCDKCGLTQIDYIVPPEIVFPPDYPYRTGLTNMLIRNFRALADTLEKQGYATPKSLIVDIGSNDGTLLQGFKEKGMKVVGVEPTGAADVAKKNGITTIKSFFNKETVATILKKYGPAKIITATNVFAHINDTVSLAKNVKDLLATDGVFVSESQYLLDIFEKLEFDTVYHEHLRFYALQPLQHLFAQVGLSVVDAERISAAGGSIRVYAMKGKHQMSTRAKELLAVEKKAGLYDVKAHKKFAERIILAKHDLVALLLKVKKQGARIAGLGSPARANTLLGFTKITTDILDYACEKKGSPKIGLFTPGTHIPVFEEEKLFKEQPEYVLVLSWHIGMELIKKTKEAGFKGKFIMPLPIPRIIK
ncbi:MAG: class I SAM-dependent methyltransferase [Patescibacteria group bacterium]|nr:class I SAM-dependent methyltransferase [Patescibacteria group bacterium]